MATTLHTTAACTSATPGWTSSNIVDAPPRPPWRRCALACARCAPRATCPGSADTARASQLLDASGFCRALHARYPGDQARISFSVRVPAACASVRTPVRVQSQAICAPGAHEGDSELLTIGLLALAMQPSAPCTPRLAPWLLLQLPPPKDSHLGQQLAASPIEAGTPCCRPAADRGGPGGGGQAAARLPLHAPGARHQG